MSDGAPVRVRCHGNPEGPRLLLSHGNGFAIDGYFVFWRQFLEDFDVVVHDVRNHGQNPPAGSLGHHIRQFAADQKQIVEELNARHGLKPQAAVVHSVSSLAAILNTVTHGLLWDALVLADPPLIPPPGHRIFDGVIAFESALAAWALNRPRRFSDPAELGRRMAETRSMQGWIEGSHEALARAITRPDGEGGYVLCCPPELETIVYLQNARSGLWTRLGGLAPHRDKILFLGADGEMAGAKGTTRVSRAIAEDFGYRQKTVENTTHLLQLERPEEIARIVVEFLAEHGVAPALAR